MAVESIGMSNGYADFLIANNVLVMAAGISFGQATLQLLKSFVADMLMPLIYMALVGIPGVAAMQMGGGGKKGAAASGFLATVLAHKELRFANFIAEVITYVLILLTAYLLITYVFKRYVVAPAQSQTQQAQTHAQVQSQTRANTPASGSPTSAGAAGA
jgi:large-conductance mechanosensitive channel